MVTGLQTHQCGPTCRKLNQAQSPSVDSVHIPYLIQGSWVALLRDSSSQELKILGGGREAGTKKEKQMGSGRKKEREKKNAGSTRDEVHRK